MKKSGELTMKKFANPIWVRAALATLVCASFVIYPLLRLSSAQAAAAPVADLKTESQLRTEASRYDAAIRAIGGVASMRLDTPADLAKAVAVLDRERPNLRFHRSKFVVIGLNDAAFLSSVRKKLPNKQVAETFATQLAADSKLALTVDGAAALRTRITSSIESDAATLRRAAERLRDAAAKFKRAQITPGSGVEEFKVLKAGFSSSPRSIAQPETFAMPAIDPASVVVIVVAVIVYTLVISYALRWYGPSIGIGTEEDKDQVADCQNATDRRYTQCVAEARDLPSGLPFFVREVATAACYADWLARQAACLTLYI